MASIFTKIIQGELPSHKIYEDEHVYAFLTIDPIRPGHALVIPKKEIDSVLQVPEPYHSAVFTAGQKIGRAIMAATGCKRIGYAVQGFEVPHFHLHLIPMWSPDDFSFRNAKRAEPAELKEMREKIAARLVET